MYSYRGKLLWNQGLSTFMGLINSSSDKERMKPANLAELAERPPNISSRSNSVASYLLMTSWVSPIIPHQYSWVDQIWFNVRMILGKLEGISLCNNSPGFGESHSTYF